MPTAVTMGNGGRKTVCLFGQAMWDNGSHTRSKVEVKSTAMRNIRDWVKGYQTFQRAEPLQARL